MRTPIVSITAFVTILTPILVNCGSLTLDWQLLQNPRYKVQNFSALAQAPNTSKVEANQQQLITIYEPIQNIEWEGQFLSPQGIAYFSSSEVAPDWLLTSDLAVEYARQNSDRKAEAKALFELGLANHVIGSQFDKAIAFYQQSLEIAKEINDQDLEVMLLGNLGLAYLENGFYYIEPIDYLKEYWGYTWHKGYSYKGTDPKLGGIALGNLGNAYYSADLYAEAINYHQKRFTLSQEIKDKKGEGKALGDQGVVYQAIGEFAKAVQLQQQRLIIARTIKDRQGEGKALSNLGIIYQTQGDYNKAIEAQQQYLTISREIKDPLGEEQALGNLGGAYYFLGDYQKAIKFYEKSLAVAQNNREAKIANKVRGNLGLVYYQLGNYQKALELYNQFFQSASYSSSRREEAVAHNNTGVAKFKSGDTAGAIESLFKGIEVLEDLRKRLGDNNAYKVSIFETQNSPYVNLQRILADQSKNDAALEVAERGRARAFVELLERRLSSKLSGQCTTAKSCSPPVLKIEQIKQIAKAQNSTLVEYSIVSEKFNIQGKLQTQESELLIWVIKPTGEVALRRVDLKPLWQKQNTFLEDFVVNSRNAMGVRGRGLNVVARAEQTRNAGQLQQLYQLLIQPIADLLPADPNARVTFLPQGSLFLVPFAALQDNQGKYLIERHTILTAPAIQILDFTHQQRQNVSGKEVLIVGNPTMPSVPPALGEPPEPLPSLPGAEREAKAIAQILNTKAITGNQATKLSILPQLTKARIVHLATHGLLDDFQGLGIPGAIALAPADKDNGLLTAGEILNLKLNAELVVLSACDTGRGTITGDGVIGLSRSLISAGIPSVIVSLWSVPDSPTASLMTEFYQKLQKNPDKAQALRQAMLTTMKQHPDPRDWAAFTLIGEAE